MKESKTRWIIKIGSMISWGVITTIFLILPGLDKINKLYLSSFAFAVFTWVSMQKVITKKKNKKEGS